MRYFTFDYDTNDHNCLNITHEKNELSQADKECLRVWLVEYWAFFSIII